MCRLHERKLQRLQQEEEAELVAQRERELELQVRRLPLTPFNKWLSTAACHSTVAVLGTTAVPYLWHDQP